MSKNLNQTKVQELLNAILEQELAGVVRYTHYSFMVFGHNRIPIVSWLRSQATEGLDHAHRAGEMITNFGGHPSLGIGPMLETHNHDVNQILKEALDHEQGIIQLYYDLLKEVEGKSLLLEEYARQMIVMEEEHAGEINKMLRKPGAIEVYEHEKSCAA